VIRLGDVAHFEMGQAPPGIECNTARDGVLFVKAGEFGSTHPVEREWTTKPLKFGRKGDVFVCVVGATAGKLNLGIDCAIGRSVAAIRPSAKLDARFLYYQLHPWVLKLRVASAGSAQGVITKKQLAAIGITLPTLEEQTGIVAEIEKQFSRLDEAVANLNRVKTNAQHFKRATIQAQTASNSFSTKIAGTVADIAVSLDNMREPVNKTERAKRVGTIPYLGANGQTGWIDEARFDEELVLVVEDETFVGRKLPFSYYFSGKCWVNNHTHVLRARSDAVLPKYLNLALSYYPFIPLTTGSTGRRKLTKAALMSAPIVVPDLATQHRIVAEVDRRLSIVREVESEVDANLKRAQVLRQAVLARAFAPPGATCAGQSEHVVATA